MDRETLSNYGWITIVTLVLAVMLALATPFGTYVGDGVVSIARGYVDTSEKKLNNDNVKEMGSKWDGKFENGVASGEVSDTTEIKRKAGSIIPTGATYTPSGKAALTGNGTNKFPNTPAENDKYKEEDYTYTFKSSKNGWTVSVNNSAKTEFGIIISTIVNKPVVSLSNTFFNCNNMTTAPKIPNTITDISNMFNGNNKLKTYVGSTDSDGNFSNYKIPSGVTDMSNAFYHCDLITAGPAIPSGVTTLYGSFAYTKITTSPAIPDSVTTMGDAFRGCSKLTVAPKLSNKVVDLSYAFSGTAITVAPAIPNSVKNMKNTFYNCKSLTTVSKIPSSVTDMTMTFNNCTALTGTIVIDATPTKYDDCFYGITKSILLKGNSTNLKQIANTSRNNLINYEL